VDGIIRLIEGIVRGLVGLIQPLFENGNLGYLIPFVVLAITSILALINKNRMSLAGYILGWIIGIALIGVYLETNGDNVLINLTGNVPRSDILLPGLIGLFIGFVPLIPFIRMKLPDAAPILITFATACTLLLMFLAYRASASIPIVQSQGVEDIIVYRKRYIGILALGLGAGLLAHLVVSAANPPKPPPPPPKSGA
jgi:hypothetical protein